MRSCDNGSSSLAEARDQHLAKESKIDTMLKAVGLDNIAAAAEIEEQAVRHRLAKSGLLPQGSASDVGDRQLTIADNITYVQKTSPWPWVIAACALLTGAMALGWSFWEAARRAGKAPPRTVPAGEGELPVSSEPLRLKVRWWVDQDGAIRYEVREDGR